MCVRVCACVCVCARACSTLGRRNTLSGSMMTTYSGCKNHMIEAVALLFDLNLIIIIIIMHIINFILLLLLLLLLLLFIIITTTTIIITMIIVIEVLLQGDVARHAGRCWHRVIRMRYCRALLQGAIARCYSGRNCRALLQGAT